MYKTAWQRIFYQMTMFITCEYVYFKPEQWSYILQKQCHLTHWVIPKRIPTPPTEEISTVQGGWEGSCPKNVLNLYRMSQEGEGVL